VVIDGASRLGDILPGRPKTDVGESLGRSVDQERTAAPKRSIELRPTAANNRERIGDFEVDTVVGKRGSKAAV